MSTTNEKQVRGGQARAAKLSPERRREIAQKAIAIRWDPDILRATHEGVLRIGSVEIPCAVLRDGQRVITQKGFLQAIGRSPKANSRGRYRESGNLPVFIASSNLKPFIPATFTAPDSVITFMQLRGGKALGYSADLLPQVCEIFLDAESAGVLLPAQRVVAERAKILLRALAKIGIMGLIDEVTGFQEVRDREALQGLLDLYLRKELANWAKKFPDQFYEQIFRLKGWPRNPLKVARPQIIGKYTLDVVYQRLAPDIVSELERRNPKTENGYRKARHHQFLTEDIGNPALTQHLHAVMGLMRISKDWDAFMKHLDKAFPKKTAEQLLLTTAQK